MVWEDNSPMDKRKATIEKIVGVKISLGNFETLEVREGIKR